jgi:WD40 repeat protein
VALLSFLKDAGRFALRNRAIIDEAPLQTYLSALLLTPSQSIVRRRFDGNIKIYLDMSPKVPEQWSAERLKLEGQGGAIHAVAISADGKIVASGSDDRTVRVWSTATGKQVLKLERHEYAVRAVAISANGKTIASGSFDKTVRVWSTATGEQTLTLKGHSDWVRAVAISADGKIVASGSDDKTVRVWSTTMGEQIQRFESHRVPSRLCFTEDGTALNTDVGLFDLSLPSYHLSTSTSPSRVPVVLVHSWVRCNGLRPRNSQPLVG